jgi:hypothetical protein
MAASLGLHVTLLLLLLLLLFFNFSTVDAALFKEIFRQSVCISMAT